MTPALLASRGNASASNNAATETNGAHLELQSADTAPSSWAQYKPVALAAAAVSGLLLVSLAATQLLHSHRPAYALIPR